MVSQDPLVLLATLGARSEVNFVLSLHGKSDMFVRYVD